MVNIEQTIEKKLKENIEVKIDEMIEKEIKKFEDELLRRKDDYIAEVMRCIRIFEEKTPDSFQHNYVIKFINEVKLKEN